MSQLITNEPNAVVLAEALRILAETNAEIANIHATEGHAERTTRCARRCARIALLLGDCEKEKGS